jgi:hypothetical protein
LATGCADGEKIAREVAPGCADVEEEKSREEWHQDA